MTIEFTEQMARFGNTVEVEDTEALLEWLQTHPQAGLDLAECLHIHTANLQVLLAAKPKLVSWPKDEALASWLRSAGQI